MAQAAVSHNVPASIARPLMSATRRLWRDLHEDAYQALRHAMRALSAVARASKAASWLLLDVMERIDARIGRMDDAAARGPRR